MPCRYSSKKMFGLLQTICIVLMGSSIVKLQSLDAPSKFCPAWVQKCSDVQVPGTDDRLEEMCETSFVESCTQKIQKKCEKKFAEWCDITVSNIVCQSENDHVDDLMKVIKDKSHVTKHNCKFVDTKECRQMERIVCGDEPVKDCKKVPKEKCISVVIKGRAARVEKECNHFMVSNCADEKHEFISS